MVHCTSSLSSSRSSKSSEQHVLDLSMVAASNRLIMVVTSLEICRDAVACVMESYSVWALHYSLATPAQWDRLC